MTEKRVTLEEKQRLSESLLWKQQRDFFDREGIDAWVKQVPFYVTGNPYIANCYANIILGFIQDLLNKDPSSINEPFYCLELGTGPGIFSFYVMKILTELLDNLHLGDVKIKYIMSDFTRSNLVYWQEHPALQKNLDSDMLDFAIFNLEDDREIHLEHSGEYLTAGAIKNPLIAIGNYIFDSVSHDAFTVKDKGLFESLVTITTGSDNIDESDQIIDWDAINVKHSDKACDAKGYYDDAVMNDVLEYYHQALMDTHFLMPVAGIKAVTQLAELSHGRLLLLTSDKAYSYLDELEDLKPSTMASHGSFSMMVNYDAFARYAKRSGGDCVMQGKRKGIKTNVFSFGMQLTDMPRTNSAIACYIQGVSPADYFTYHQHISDQYSELSAQVLVTHLNFSGWDPYMFHRIVSRLCAVVAEADEATKQYLCDGMDKIAANYYYMPVSADTSFDIGIMLHTLKQYQRAFDYYQQSEALFGENFNVFYNKGLCQHYLGNDDQAVDLFKQSLKLDPNYDKAKEWIASIEKNQDKSS